MSEHIEGRDWIGNPDGTLAYWQAETEEARTKLAKIQALVDKAREQAGVTSAPIRIEVLDVLPILRGQA